MTHPAAAILWQIWRLTRVKFLIAVIASTTLGVATWTLTDSLPGNVVIPLLVVVVAAGFMIVWVLASLQKSRSRTGFPFQSSFVRPVPTPTLALLPILYLTLVSGVSLVVPVIVVTLITGVSLPIVQMSVIVALLTGIVTSAIWWSDKFTNRAISWVFLCVLFWLIRPRAASSVVRIDESELALTLDAQFWVFLTMIAIASCALTILGVHRQRHT